MAAVRSWACQFIGDSRKAMPQAEAVQNAADFDLIVAHEFIYKPHIGAMKQANPELRLLVYCNSCFTYRTDLADAAYAKDSQNRRIYAKGWPNTFLLDPAHAAAETFKSNEAKALLSNSGYGNLYLDVVGFAPLKSTYVSGLPIDPATGAVYTREAWATAMNKLTASIRTAVGPDPYIVANCFSSGPDYWRDTKAFLTDAIDGGVTEGWLRYANDSITKYPLEPVWKQSVDMIADIEAQGKAAFQMTKIWASGMPEQKAAWYDYCVASLLSGSDGSSYLNVSFASGDNLTVRQPWRLDLGRPEGDCAKEGELYQRWFDEGRVLVNAGKTPVSADVPAASYASFAGTALDDDDAEQLTIAPNGSLIVQRP